MPETHSQDGAVAADISRGAVQLLREYTGRGPTKARTVICADTISIILADTLTRGEQSLVGMGEHDHVFHTRRNYQRLMRKDLVELVETASERTVKAFFSDNHIDPDYAVEFFLLEPLPGADDLDPPPDGLPTFHEDELHS
jgi:uncharacterized protein YbcI